MKRRLIILVLSATLTLGGSLTGPLSTHAGAHLALPPDPCKACQT